MVRGWAPGCLPLAASSRGLSRPEAPRWGRLQRDLPGSEDRRAIFLSPPTSRQLKKKRSGEGGREASRNSYR